MKTIIIRLKNKSITLPINYNSMLQGVIYRLLSYDKEIGNEIHDEGYELDDKSYKLFTFSRLHGKGVYENKMITYTGNIDFEIRFVDDRAIDDIKSSIAKTPYILLGKEILPILEYKVIDNTITSSSIDIKMITPITLHKTDEDNKTVYINYDDEDFSSMILNNAINKYRAYFGDNTRDLSLSINPISVNDRDKVVTTFKGTYITGWQGYYHLEGSNELINFLYYAGLGDRNSQGFGMFKII